MLLFFYLLDIFCRESIVSSVFYMVDASLGGRFADFSDTISYLYSKLPMYQRQGSAALRKGLRNIRALSASMGDPQLRYPSVHIAGTNGKGSTARTLAALLTASGYRTGLYTSPHICHFSERISVDLEPIAEAEVSECVEMFRPLIEKLEPSFFEISFAMALHHFAEKSVQIAVIETGLGGRWDSTNIIHPILSLVTNVSFDHAEILGDSLRMIAAEKAGIAKKGTPLLLGTIPEALLDVFEQEASAQQAPLVRSHCYRVCSRETSWKKRIIDVYQGDMLRYEGLQLALVADYYLDNLPLIFTALDELALRGFSCSEARLRSVMSGFSMKGRFEICAESPLVIADMAHNVAALQALFTQLRRMHHGDWHVVFGLSREKLQPELLAELPRGATYYVSQAQVPRACPAEVLTTALKDKGLRAVAYPCVAQAIAAARGATSDRDLILICGSVYLLGEVDISVFI